LGRLANRKEIEIVASILSSCRRGITTSELMERSNISYKLYKRYSLLLSGSQLLEIEGSGRRKINRTTDKGKEFLKEFRSVKYLEATCEKLLSRLNTCLGVE
jgi:predicted transcriptional regulator